VDVLGVKRFDSVIHVLYKFSNNAIFLLSLENDSDFSPDVEFPHYIGCVFSCLFISLLIGFLEVKMVLSKQVPNPTL